MEAYTGSRDQWAAFLVEQGSILHIDDGGSWRRGAVETRRPMCGEGLAKEGDVIRRRGGVDGREAGEGGAAVQH